MQETGMTDKQFRAFLEAILEIVKDAKTKDEAIQKIEKIKDQK